MSGEAFRFRPARESDCAELARLEAQVEYSPWKEGDFEDALRARWRCELLETESGQIAAWAVILPGVGEAELLDIGVALPLQGRGLGRAMLNRAFEIVRAEGFPQFLLEVRESNVRALRLYETSGFKRVGLRKNYYAAAGGRENAVLMTAEVEGKTC
ncbi:MAG: [Ribosomal protein S18]-alanine N-acetyltransferase [Burkholderia sp.]